MRLPRFRVRTLLVAVGAVAVLIWGVLMAGTSYNYHQRATIYGRWEWQWREMAARDLRLGRTQTVAANCGFQLSEYYSRLARKYRRATWRPWVPVAPDPRPPGSQGPYIP